MMKIKAVKLTVTFILLSLMLLNISAFILQFHEQPQAPTNMKFSPSVASSLQWSYTMGDMASSVAISSDGQYIVAGSYDYKVYLFDKASLTPLWSYTTGWFVTSVAISSDGQYIVAGSYDYKVYLFDKASSTPIWSYDTGDYVYSVAISSNGQYIVAGSYNKVYLFDRASSTPLWSYTTTGWSFSSVAISSNGQYVVAGTTYDKKVYLFDKTSSTPLWSYVTGNDVNSVAVSSDGQYIVAGSYDYKVYLFDKASSIPLWSYTTGLSVSSVAISSDGQYFVAGSADNKVYFFDRASSSLLWSYTTGGSISPVAISSNGQYIVAGSADNKVYLFSHRFTSVWDTTRTSSGSSSSNQVHLPLESSGTYNFVVNWGDMSTDTITSWSQTEVTHTYVSTGVYTITITGTIVGWRFNNEGDRLKILEIQQWGPLRLGNSETYFYGCSNLELTATDNLNLMGTTSLRGAFRDCTNLSNSGNMNGWDVSSMTTMISMFEGATSFNQPIGNWDVSSVLDMSSMFNGASSFNQPIGNWDVSSVIDMFTMFCYATSFNQSIGGWDVSSVTDISYMFYYASSFNQPIGTWNVSSVTDISYMFYYASSFNQPIDGWDVSSVTTMLMMFYRASSFNQPIDNWNVSGVTTMQGMFYEAFSFNQSIGSWDVSSVTNMGDMFLGVTLSTPNYDNLLLGWSLLTLQTGVSFHAGDSKYSNAAKDARQAIITNFAWTITDGGLATPETFTLSSNAGTPDTDGSFTLTWTSSDGANNYSVYGYFDYITEINGSLTSLAEEITDLNLPLSGYSDGTYYFIVVAYNIYGETLSNCLQIDVVITKSLTIIIPDASSSWKINTSENIIWTSTGTISDVKVELYKEGVFVMEIIASTLNDGSYTWAIPSGLEDSTQYQIKISDVSNSATYDFSDNFEIKKPSKGPSGIPGYDLYLIISIICIISVILFKNRFKLTK